MRVMHVIRRVIIVSSQMSCGLKIIIESNFNNYHLTFNGDFKNYTTFEWTQRGLSSPPY
jgi:hypothetical protein